MDQPVLNIAEVVILLVGIYPVDRPRAMVPLACYSVNVSLDLLGSVPVSVRLFDIVEILNVSRKLGLDNINHYLPPANNV